MQQKKKHKLKLEQVVPSLLQSNYEAICKLYKTIAHQLIYIINFLQLGLENIEKVKAQISILIDIISTVVQSLEPKQFGHRFPLFAFIIKKFQQQTDKKIKADNLKTLTKIEQNKESEILKSQKQIPISRKQQELLTSPIFPQICTHILNNTIILPNDNCVCCSTVFMKNRTLQNSNLYYQSIVAIDFKYGYSKNDLERYLNCLCNEGGGVLIIGGQDKGGRIQVEGIEFGNQEQIQIQQKQIYEALANIKPGCFSTVKKVLVHSNFLNQSDIAQQYLRFCFRVFVLPQKQNKMSYIEHVVKGHANRYKSYYVDCNKNVKKVAVVSKEDEEQISFYQLVHRNYKKTRRLTNSHKLIKCFKPDENYSIYFRIALQQKTINIEERKNAGKQQKFNDQPKFKYKHASLLIVPSQQQDRQVKNFALELSLDKYLVELQHPFPKSFSDKEGRSKWMLSHDLDHVKLKHKLIQYQKDKKVKGQTIKMMPIHKALQIQFSKISEQKLQKLKKRFSSRYSSDFRIQVQEIGGKNKIIEKVMQLIFDQRSQAIFAYFIFQEQLNIRPYFVKEGGSYKKK